MGTSWLVNKTDKAGVIKVIIADLPGRRTIAHSVKGNTLWVVHSFYQNGELKHKEIVCYRLSKDRQSGQWGWKEIPEGFYPFYYDCPLKFLDLAPTTYLVWREKVREYWKDQSRKIVVGETYHTVGLHCPTIFTVEEVRRRTYIGRGENGSRYALQRKHIGAKHEENQ